jgi:excisionase family DNA binding protein
MATAVAHTIKSACETYNIGRTSLYELLKTGTLRARKFGTKTLIDDASLREWFESLPPSRSHCHQADNRAQPGAV